MPTDDEYKQTLLLAVPLHEASAKVRTGPPTDKEEDADLPIWTGVLPLATMPGQPIPAPHALPGVDVPQSVTGYHRPGRS